MQWREKRGVNYSGDEDHVAGALRRIWKDPGAALIKCHRSIQKKAALERRLLFCALASSAGFLPNFLCTVFLATYARNSSNAALTAFVLRERGDDNDFGMAAFANQQQHASTFAGQLRQSDTTSVVFVTQ
ncbi:hypothetical protein OSTOST_12994 [Ostertagia ostertagi]